jgi:hypothetical protein
MPYGPNRAPTRDVIRRLLVRCHKDGPPGLNETLVCPPLLISSPSCPVPADATHIKRRAKHSDIKLFSLPPRLQASIMRQVRERRDPAEREIGGWAVAR